MASTLSDGSTDGDAATLSSDPCPVFVPSYTLVDLDCDPACVNQSTGQGANCARVSCAGKGTLSAGVPVLANTSVVRTPRAPGVDPLCADDCPSHSWAYGLSITVTANTPPNQGIQPYKVTVSPPWYLISGTSTPFCQALDASGPTGCLWFDGSSGETIYVVTNDPNAPARNVVFQDSANPSACP
jgi:hypothetical protein